MSVYSNGCNVSSGTFYPRYKLITGVTLGFTTRVIFGISHDFTDGEIVSFRVSKPFGTVELNNQQSRVLSHDSTSITVGIDSTNYTPFVNAGSDVQIPAVTVPSASGVIPNTSSVNLEDAFDDKPPN